MKRKYETEGHHSLLKNDMTNRIDDTKPHKLVDIPHQQTTMPHFERVVLRDLVTDQSTLEMLLIRLSRNQ